MTKGNPADISRPMKHQLAQINVARCKAPLDSPVMRDFVDLLDAVNALADATPGFIWRLKTDEGDATGVKAFEDPLIIVNMSVWGGIEALRDYVYKNSHGYAFRKRKEWFEEMTTPRLALWWIPVGHIPTVEEGKQRLEALEREGPTPIAFTFKDAFEAPQ
jgi:hypothetical protein